MPKFDKASTEGLKEFLYNSYDHDAKLENVIYGCGKDSIKLNLFNPIFNVKIALTFYNIRLALAVKGKEYGSHETVISIIVQEDFSYLHNHLPKYSECLDDSLYLMVQMFSGDELHIVSKEVIVEITKQTTGDSSLF